MRKGRRLELALVIAGAFAVCNRPEQTVAAEGFDFDDGTVQGWTLTGAYDPGTGNRIFPSHFLSRWNDSTNYPKVPGSDPVGDERGSLELYTPGGHGIDNAGSTWWRMRLISPDLSSSVPWQEASGYTVRIADRMAEGRTTLYVNLFVVVYDLEQKRKRTFTNGMAVPLTPGIWNYYRHSWSSPGSFPTDYILQSIFINVWGTMAGDSQLEGGVYLDEITPILVDPYVYVDDDGGGPNEDGTKENPFDTIQEGIDEASGEQAVVIRDGTYAGAGNRDIDFTGKSIIVRSENGPSNCLVDCGGTADEQHRGFYFAGREDADSVLQGLTIVNGYAEKGGGIYCLNSSPTVVNCVIKDNRASARGGGICCEDSSPAVSNCMVIRNSAQAGGGIYCDNGNATITGCTISDNDADEGGALCCSNSTVGLSNSVLWGNTAAVRGAEIALVDSSRPSALAVSYSDVAGGSAAAHVEPGSTLTWGAGNIELEPRLKSGTYRLQSDSPCIDSGDPAIDLSDKLDVDNAPRVFNGRIDIGADEFSPQIHNTTQDTYHDTIQQAVNGSSDADVILVPDGIYTGTGNRDISFNGKAITLRSVNGPDKCIIDCRGTEQRYRRGFNFNNGEDADSVLAGFTIMNGLHIQTGGVWCVNSNPTITQCAFVRNRTGDGGGAVYCGGSSPTISNCTFTSNSAGWGGAIGCKGSSPTISNCTFTRNVADWGGGIYCTFLSKPAVVNCILHGNIASRQGNELALKGGRDPSTLTISYSNVAGGSLGAYVESGCTLDWGSGNEDVDPLLTADGHLQAGSPCIDAGTDVNSPLLDRDNEERPGGDGFDMGCDEFIDTDEDMLPDWWEEDYFGAADIADASADRDGDGLSNLAEYELYSSDPKALPYHVNPDNGDDSYDGLSPQHQGGNAGPKKTIQAALDTAGDGDTVLMAPGTYTGHGNRSLDFAGKSIVLHGPNGPDSTIVDCEHIWSSALNFHSHETPGAAVVGLTIANVARSQGRAIVCWKSHPQIRNCIINSNSDNGASGALYCYMSMPTLYNCDIGGDSQEGVWIEYGGVKVMGTVRTASNDWVGANITLCGDGTLQMQSDVTLDLDDSTIRCNLSGPATVLVGPDSELIVEGEALIDLGHVSDPNGQIMCDGLLRLRDDASIMDADLHVTRANLQDNAILVNCVINAEAGVPYGQFFVEDNVHIWLDKIDADGDHYLDLDPSEFDCNNIHVDAIDISVTEGTGGSKGGLFELRGEDLGFATFNPGEFLCQVSTVPDFDPKTWTIDQLELTAGAKLNLTNRFDFQAPYDQGGDDEVLYVKHLILGPDSILNTAFNRVYYANLTEHPTSRIINVPLLGFSLRNIALDDENDFIARVRSNNFEHAENPAFDRIHVERVEGKPPDPNGMMIMRNLPDIDPESMSAGQIVHARAKGLFAKASETETLIIFEYLFDCLDGTGELAIYLSDTPELLDHSDMRRAEHYLEVARLFQPPPGQYGSTDSDHFAVFEKTVFAGHLDFTRGLRMELELVGAEGTCVLINNWDPFVGCIYCGDVTGDFAVSPRDYMTVLGEVGQLSSGSNTYGQELYCLDFAFSDDGFVNTTDLAGWDWGEYQVSEGLIDHLCFDLCLGCGPTAISSSAGSNAPASQAASGSLFYLTDLGDPNGSLLIAGKRFDAGAMDFLSDRLYGFDRDRNLVSGPFARLNDRANGKLVRDHEGALYQVNLEESLVRLSDGVAVVPRGHGLSLDSEPRYGQPAMIYVGFQGQGESTWGRPVLDAAFDTQGYVYVTPTVIVPALGEPYVVSAKLELLAEQTPPYDIVEVYDDPPLPGNNQDRNNLREIEVDDWGNVYVINSDYANNGDILWIYGSNGSVKKCTLQGLGIFGPVGLCCSRYDSSRLYMACSLTRPDAKSISVYTLSTAELALLNSTEVLDMGHITDITEDPVSGTLWIAGFTMPKYVGVLPGDLSRMPQFYDPYLASAPYGGAGPVQATHLFQAGDLALPISVLWIGDRQ